MDEIILFGKDFTNIVSFTNNDIIHTIPNIELLNGIYYKNHIIVHNTDTIKIYNIISTDDIFQLKEITKIPCKYSSLTKPSIVSTIDGDVYTFVTNNNYMVQYKIYMNINQELSFGISKKYHIINNNDLDYDICYITHQDMYIYTIQYDNKLNIYNLIILEPSIKVFGKIELPNFKKEPLLIGKDLFYITNDNKIISLCLLEKKITHIEPNITEEIKTFTILNTDDYFIISDKYVGLYSNKYNILYPITVYENQYHYTNYIIPNSDVDFKNTMCNLNNSLVLTYYKNQLNPDCKSICEIMTETASMIYRSEKLKQIVEKYTNLHTKSLSLSRFRSNQTGIYIGTSLKDIIHPHENIFKRPTNYQHMLNDMIHIIDDEDMNKYAVINKDAFRNEDIDTIKQFVIQKGIFILPYYEMSGRFHYIIPHSGKGWHHNIESVPDELCDVIYFVATDINEYGGSFFLYRHLISKKIHAVPDIHGTMKQFFLRSDTASPLWHAIFSFKANRLSVGFSKKRDLQSNDIFLNKDSTVLFNKPI